MLAHTPSTHRAGGCNHWSSGCPPPPSPGPLSSVPCQAPRTVAQVDVPRQAVPAPVQAQLAQHREGAHRPRQAMGGPPPARGRSLGGRQRVGAAHGGVWLGWCQRTHACVARRPAPHLRCTDATRASIAGRIHASFSCPTPAASSACGWLGGACGAGGGVRGTSAGMGKPAGEWGVKHRVGHALDRPCLSSTRLWAMLWASTQLLVNPRLSFAASLLWWANWCGVGGGVSRSPTCEAGPQRVPHGHGVPPPLQHGVQRRRQLRLADGRAGHPQASSPAAKQGHSGQQPRL
jgi:hypothetical protein